MTGAELAARAAVALASSDLALDDAVARLVTVVDGDRLALEVARANIMRDGLPRRHRPAPPGRSRGRNGSLRNRTLNLLEHAIHEASGVAVHAQYRWDGAPLETWE